MTGWAEALREWPREDLVALNIYGLRLMLKEASQRCGVECLAAAQAGNADALRQAMRRWREAEGLVNEMHAGIQELTP